LQGFVVCGVQEFALVWIIDMNQVSLPKLNGTDLPSDLIM